VSGVALKETLIRYETYGTNMRNLMKNCLEGERSTGTGVYLSDAIVPQKLHQVNFLPARMRESSARGYHWMNYGFKA
jgi:hypothetical protein